MRLFPDYFVSDYLELLNKVSIYDFKNFNLTNNIKEISLF